MKYIRRTSKDIKENFLLNLLIDRQIITEDNQKEYFHPTKDNMLSPELLDNMEKGFYLIKSNLNKKITICVDPDLDGFTSSAILYLYLKRYKPDIDITYLIPEGKAHGLEQWMDYFSESKKCDLIICPDSSSNDYDYHKKLCEMEYDILVLDHHMAEKYSEYAVVINNQLSERYENKCLSGVGVVYKFLQYCDKNFGVSYADDYIDLVSVGETGDMMDLNTLENRFIIDYGLNNIKNAGLKGLLREQAYSIYKVSKEAVTDSFIQNTPITQINIAFYIAPLVNALIRVGTQTEKELLFRAFIEGDMIVPSTKRGHAGEEETIAEQNARNCTNARSRQNKEKERASELLDIQISNDCLDDNKILILNSDELNIKNTMTGLVAMDISSKYKKPVMLGKTNSDGVLKGSIRGRGETELKDFREFLLSSNLMDYVEGHPNSAGFGIKRANIDKLIKYANEKLKDINFNEGFYEVDFICNGNCSYLKNLIFDLDKGKFLYGQNNPEPLILVNEIPINSNSYDIVGARKDTVRINYNGIIFIKFFAKDLIEELENNKGKKINMNIVGKPNVNEWRGNYTPQILIDGYELKEQSIYDF